MVKCSQSDPQSSSGDGHVFMSSFSERTDAENTVCIMCNLVGRSFTQRHAEHTRLHCVPFVLRRRRFPVKTFNGNAQLHLESGRIRNSSNFRIQYYYIVAQCNNRRETFVHLTSLAYLVHLCVTCVR